jgi:Phage capsid protein
MAETAFQALYDSELIAGYERNQSVLRNTTTTRGIVKGNTFVFDVVDSGSATAVTRGVNGEIPGRANSQAQVTLQMAEWHDRAEMTGFNIFSSQGDQRAALQRTSMGVINRKVDDLIIAALGDGTQFAGATAATLDMSLAMRALVILGNGNVPTGNDVTGLISPAAWGYLLQQKEVTSKDYIDTSMLVSAPKMFRWLGMEWIVHSGLPGNGTASEELYVYHKAAIGCGMNTAGIQSPVGYDDKHDMSWARTSFYGGAKKLQNAGIVCIRHDGSGFAATA